VHDFVFFASDNIIHRDEDYRSNEGKTIRIELFVQPENEKMIRNYFETAESSLNFLSSNIGRYPYEKIVIVDVPRTSRSEDLAYPELLTIKSPLFSPGYIIDSDFIIAKGISKQYFYSVLASDRMKEAWISNGISAYLANRILKGSKKQIPIYFKLASYYPIKGMKFLSYREIPLVYSLGDHYKYLYSDALEKYYGNVYIGKISDVSSNLPNAGIYKINSLYKPMLMFLILDRYLGGDTLLTSLSTIYSEYLFTHIDGDQLVAALIESNEKDLTWFFDNILYKSKIFDHYIENIVPLPDNRYSVTVARKGDGIFDVDVVLYTDKDTLRERWLGKERWKSLIFETSNRVIGAEVDPGRVNLLDLNYSNNSKMLEADHWQPLALAVKWFFWMQNALMVLGSIG
jgi:hypothetical protein